MLSAAKNPLWAMCGFFAALSMTGSADLAREHSSGPCEDQELTSEHRPFASSRPAFLTASQYFQPLLLHTLLRPALHFPMMFRGIIDARFLSAHGRRGLFNAFKRNAYLRVSIDRDDPHLQSQPGEWYAAP